MHCSYATTDNNTSTDMIWVTLNMGRSVMNCQGISHRLESGHPVYWLLNREIRLFVSTQLELVIELACPCPEVQPLLGDNCGEGWGVPSPHGHWYSPQGQACALRPHFIALTLVLGPLAMALASKDQALASKDQALASKTRPWPWEMHWQFVGMTLNLKARQVLLKQT